MKRRYFAPLSGWLAVLCALAPRPAHAELAVAEPEAPVRVAFPADAPQVEVQVVLALVVDDAGHVESALVSSHLPADAPAVFDAVEAVLNVPFKPSMRDGKAFRSRVEYVVVFHPPAAAAAVPGAPPPAPPNPTAKPSNASMLPNGAAASAATQKPLDADEQDEDYALTIEVRGKRWSSPRGVGDIRIKRELLDAAPHQQTSELLAAAPGFSLRRRRGSRE